MGAPWLSSSCHSCLHTQLQFPVNPAPKDFHTGTTKNYNPTTTIQQQEPTPLSTHFHLVASTGQIPSTCVTPESPLLFFKTYINTIHNHGSKDSAMVAIATDTYATSMQPYPSQPQLSRGTNLLIKTVSVRPSYMESPTGFSEAPLKQHFPTFHYKTSSFSFFSSSFQLPSHFFFIRTLEMIDKR